MQIQLQKQKHAISPGNREKIKEQGRVQYSASIAWHNKVPFQSD